VCLALPGPLAAAQPAPAPRQRVDRRVILQADAPEPVDTLRLAPSTLTTLLFDARLDTASVELEGKDLRIRLMDVGERSLLLEAALELNPSERYLLRVRFLDGALPERAVFALVSHPTLVDGEVRVSRRSLTPEACQAELSQLRSRCTQAPSPADFLLAGWVEEGGVDAVQLKPGRQGKSTSELVMTQGRVYSTPEWIVVLVKVENHGQQPWVPTQAKLTGPAQGTLARARAVRMKGPAIAPGETAFIAVEAVLPPVNSGVKFSLELADASGQRTLVISELELRKDGSKPGRGTP
jgi:uncharacterized protein (TIGR02268 family)